jgi:hypothetical protein
MLWVPRILRTRVRGWRVHISHCDFQITELFETYTNNAVPVGQLRVAAHRVLSVACDDPNYRPPVDIKGSHVDEHGRRARH